MKTVRNRVRGSMKENNQKRMKDTQRGGQREMKSQSETEKDRIRNIVRNREQMEETLILQQQTERELAKRESQH